MIFLILLAALALFAAILYFMLYQAVTRVWGAKDGRCMEILRNMGGAGHLDFYENKPWGECRITSFDETELYGRYLECGNAKKTAILVHGYGMTGLIMLRFAPAYYEAGCHVLMVDMRAHGKSGGKAVAYGQEERHDLAAWIDFIAQKDPEQRIILHGESMGAATALQYLGAYSLSDALPDNVRAAVVDCPYTNAYDAAEAAGRVWFRMPTRPFMKPLNWIYGLVNGVTLEEVDTLALIPTIRTPLLFICGGRDEIFPLEMEKKLYDAAAGEKEMHVFAEAGHARSYALQPERYDALIRDFQKQHLYPDLEQEQETGLDRC
ncbi:MAG: alpha/beta hydrolase [Christensenellales bacterium]|jgi:fermentation-respiration switch protein FrsA (DUF1100 family)